MNAYIERVINDVRAKNGGEPEFLQTVEEVYSSLDAVVEKHPEYEPGRCFSLVTDVEAIDVSSNNDEPCDDQKDSDYYEDKG